MKLKIAMVSVYPESPDIVKGGVERVSNTLIHSLKAQPDVELFVLAPCVTRQPGVEFRDGVTIHWLPVPKLPGVLHYWSLYRLTIHKHLLKIAPDITHFQGVAGWSLGYQFPSVLTIHGIGEKDILFSRSYFRYVRHKVVSLVEKLGRERSPNIIGINPYVLDEIGTQIKGRYWPIENPTAKDFFSIKRNLVAPQILFTGHISPRKNIDGLIRSFARLHKHLPEATLRLAGSIDDQEYQERCVKLIRQNGISKSVYFLGSLNDKNLLSELSHASCLALVSHQETAPMVVAESMAAGVPVVASHLNGLPYMIDEGQNGFLVNPKNESDIANRLMQLLDNEKLNTAMSQCCRQIAMDRFHPDHVAKKTLEVYKEVLEHRAG